MYSTWLAKILMGLLQKRVCKKGEACFTVGPVHVNLLILSAA